MIKIFNRVVVRHSAAVSVLVEHSTLLLGYDNPFHVGFQLQKPAYMKEEFKHGPFSTQILLSRSAPAGIAYIKPL